MFILSNLKLKWIKIKAILEKQRISHLIHYTTLQNLKGIIRSKAILSRKLIGEDKITFKNGSEASLIDKRKGKNKDEYVPLYYTIKTPMVHKTEGIKNNELDKHKIIPIYLCINPKILLNENIWSTTAHFTSSKSASFEDILKTFEEIEWKYFDLWRRKMIEGRYISMDDDEYKKMCLIVQAEVDIFQKIELKYIEKILVRSPAELNYAKKICEDSELLDKLELNPDAFYRKRTYIIDYSFEKTIFKITLSNSKTFQKIRINFIYSNKTEYSWESEEYQRVYEISLEDISAGKFHFTILINRMEVISDS
ncbi:MAG TPA: DarT ssDNA thymidine ADP-ribosyltransferase family protein, partial [Candidatus Deferrimicrobium sp.]|nr:DarT ssDNA thymidine ADP-ribosyltransferase family protein [Candidatus Deferrimicrobium sp.]